jgi:excisionase family DNA binding protein
MVTAAMGLISRALPRAEVALRLGVSERTLARLVASGEFPAGRRIGPRLIRWTEQDVTEYLDGCKQSVAG